MSRARLGLALSGGGFRASLFHLGVLARLAELRLLRRVEVISTVSGGSIIGAAYYLRLRQLLQSKPDDQIDDRHYLRLVADLEDRFRQMLSENIRGRIFSSPAANLRMLLPIYNRRGHSYSRTDRIGDLFDRHLYKHLWGEDPGRTEGDPRGRQIELRELRIRPYGEKPGFKPDRGNDDRTAKVPILILNATTLNTGHGWRFEAVRMGEHLEEAPPEAEFRGREIDKNRRLAPGYFDDRPGRSLVPEPQRDFPLGLAVAASAAVPGIFPPLALSGMYEGARVQLVDGGVHDNQGVQALVDRCCSAMIVSDASRQMADKPKPRPWLPMVLVRSSSVFSDRVRELQLLHAHPAEDEPADATTMALLHLRKGITARTVHPGSGWEAGEDEPPDPGPEKDSWAFDVHPDNQSALAAIRTDLDSFDEIEASSLCCDGYLIAGHVLEGRLGEFVGDDAPPAATPLTGAWHFKQAVAALCSPELARRLGPSRHRFLRALRVGGQRRAAILSGLLIGAALGVAVLGLIVLLGLLVFDSGGGWVGGVLAALLAAFGFPLAASRLMLLSGWVARRRGTLESFPEDQDLSASRPRRV